MAFVGDVAAVALLVSSVLLLSAMVIPAVATTVVAGLAAVNVTAVAVVAFAVVSPNTMRHGAAVFVVAHIVVGVPIHVSSCLTLASPGKPPV